MTERGPTVKVDLALAGMFVLCPQCQRALMVTPPVPWYVKARFICQNCHRAYLVDKLSVGAEEIPYPAELAGE